MSGAVVTVIGTVAIVVDVSVGGGMSDVVVVGVDDCVGVVGGIMETWNRYAKNTQRIKVRTSTKEYINICRH